jgi:putative ABC transport system substrate-binding protein
MTSSRHVAKLANLALGCVVGAALTAAADAQTVKIRHVGVLVPGGSYAAAIEGLRDGLKELGLQDGKQVVLHVRDLKGDLRGVGLEAKALEQQKVDLIVSVTTSVSLATKRSGVKVPIVFYAGSDPVEAGLVRSFATPGVNMTGVCSLVSDLTAKRLQLLKEIVPDLNRVATLYDPDSAVSRRTLALARDAAQKLGFQYVAREVRSVGELTQELQALTHEDAGALFLVSGAMVSSQTPAIVAAAKAKRMPTMFYERSAVAAGGLASYGVSYYDVGRLAAKHVQRVLSGTPAADLPIESFDRFELVLNARTAREIGLKIPASVLGRADQVFE